MEKTDHVVQKRSPGLPNSLSDNATLILTSTSTVSPTAHADATEKPAAKSDTTPIATVNSQGTEMRKGEKEKKPLDAKLLLTKNLGVNGTGIRKNIIKEGTILNVTSIPTTMLNSTKETTSIKPATESVSVVPKTNQTVIEDDDLNYPNPFDDYNKSMSEYNITKTKEDYHQFYNSSLNQDPEIAQKLYWVDLKNKTEVKISDLLSQSHRRAAVSIFRTMHCKTYIFLMVRSKTYICLNGTFQNVYFLTVHSKNVYFLDGRSQIIIPACPNL